MKILKIAGLSLLCSLGAATAANASIIINITQQGTDVVATVSGAVDTTGLTDLGSYASYYPAVSPSYALIRFGDPNATFEKYSGFSGPASFGPGSYTLASSTGVGNMSFNGSSDWLFLPQGYVAGTALSASDTWSNATFASLGLTTGTYIYTWGTGQDADSLTINIGNPVAVPEPPSIALLIGGMLSLATFAAMRRRKTANAA